MLISELKDIFYESEIKNIYISNYDYWHITTQSCDCQKIIVDTGDKFVLFEHQKFEDNGCIIFDLVEDFDKNEFIYKVDFGKEQYTYNEARCFDNGFVDGIKFVCNDVYLFIFASEYNLIFTKTRDDLFDDESVLFEDDGELMLSIDDLSN